MSLIGFASDQIACIRKRDPSLKSKLEILFFPSFRALNAWYISHRLYKKGHYFLARWISLRAQFKTGIDIHPGATIGRNLFIDHGIGVVIGETAVIGDDVTIFQGVTLGGTGKETGKRHPTVEDGVIIGAGAKIIGNITLGKYSKIGAGSIIVKSVPAFTTMVPTPAHPVRVADEKVPVLTITGLDARLSKEIDRLQSEEHAIKLRLDQIESACQEEIWH